MGFTLSPVLWRKLPGSRSAGRVQSVALRLICEREAEIEAFRPREYWTVEAAFLTPAGAPFTARLTHLDGKQARPVRPATTRRWRCGPRPRSRPARSPSPRSSASGSSATRRAPFTTSTLQQEASRKLGFGAQQTMRLAQQLYEGVDIDGETVGLITYMRTDGVQMAREAIAAIRDHVQRGLRRRTTCPAAPREYTSRAKNAQEAHEAIRPTDVARTPDSVAALPQRRPAPAVRAGLEARGRQPDAVGRVRPGDGGDGRRASRTGRALRATGSIMAFDGFLKLYREDHDDVPGEADAEDADRMLPPMRERDPLRTPARRG